MFFGKYVKAMNVNIIKIILDYMHTRIWFKGNFIYLENKLFPIVSKLNIIDLLKVHASCLSTNGPNIVLPLCSQPNWACGESLLTISTVFWSHDINTLSPVVAITLCGRLANVRRTAAIVFDEICPHSCSLQLTTDMGCPVHGLPDIFGLGLSHRL